MNNWIIDLTKTAEYSKSDLTKSARNMSYCRFENTYNGLEDCYDALEENERNLGESENLYKKLLIDLCKKIVEEFGSDYENNHE